MCFDHDPPLNAIKMKQKVTRLIVNSELNRARSEWIGKRPVHQDREEASPSGQGRGQSIGIGKRTVHQRENRREAQDAESLES